MKKIIALLLLPLSLFAQDGKSFELKGKLKINKPVDKVFLIYRADGKSITDSFMVKDGNFYFKGKVAEPTMAKLRVEYKLEPGEQNAKMKTVPLFLQSGKLSFTAKDSITNYTVAGSAAHKEFEGLLKLQKPYTDLIEQLSAEYSSYGKVSDKAGMNATEHKIDSVDNLVKENVLKPFLAKHASSPIALYVLKQYAGYGMDGNKIAPLFASLPVATQKWPSAIEFKEQIEVAQKTGLGKMAMDFIQNDTLGNPVSLSSFRGKYVLVDFWASWCGPCRRENPNVVKVFNQYKDKGFTVLGVSLDRPNAKDKWMKAIHDDNLTWTQVSDLKFWDNEVARLYGINAIPQNLLIDPQGKIIAKNLRGEDLEDRLSEIFSSIAEK